MTSATMHSASPVTLEDPGLRRRRAATRLTRGPAVMTSGDDKLRSAAAAELAGVGLSTWSAYVSRGQAPEADGHYDLRTPWWYRSSIESWKASRPGQGSRKHAQASDSDSAVTGGGTQ